MIILAAAALAIMLACRVEIRRLTLPMVAAVGVAVQPALGFGFLAVAGIVQLRSRRRWVPIDPLAPVEVAQLLAVGAAAGLSVRQSLAFCAERGPPELHGELITLLRRAQFDGLEPAAAAHDGRLADLLAVIATAMRSGAPIELMLRSHADEARAELAGRRIARARKLPGVLAVPLALLLLPGFVLMVMGPAVLEIAARMLMPLSGA